MKKIMISFREGGENGGPYNSHKRIMESKLKEKYNFVPLNVKKGRLGLINPSLTWSIIRQIKTEKPDIIHYTGLELIGFHISLACKIINFKNTVLAIHGSSLESTSYSQSKFKINILKILEKLTISFSSKIYCVSEYVNSWPALNSLEKNYGVIYNIVNNSNENNSLLSKNSKQSEEISVISTGRVEVEKGFQDLEKIIKESNSIHGIKFYIIGDGNYLEIMKRNLDEEIKKGKVEFLGYMKDVNPFLAFGDVFIMPSHHETFCMSLAEARSYNMILLGSKIGGIPEIIEDGVNGHTYDVGDWKSYVSFLESVTENKSLYNSWKSKVLKVEHEKFHTNDILYKLNDLYDSFFKLENKKRK
ncbi:MAG: hypothetical protein C0425_10895 [Chlorobiaceae bacterium]|nr:hypothetical protein [Chlorobiaceae bacterium]